MAEPAPLQGRIVAAHGRHYDVEIDGGDRRQCYTRGKKAGPAVGDLLLRYWLARRQIRHVLAHRDAVPAAFADRIGLHSHQRAADYTVARCQLSMIERIVEAAVLLGLTLLGGLQA